MILVEVLNRLDPFWENSIHGELMRTLSPSSLSRTLALIPPAVALMAQQSHASFTTFLKIDSIPGEVTQKGREGWIKLSMANWGTSRSITSGGSGGSRTTSPPSFSEVTVTKLIDKASSQLFLAALVGTANATPIRIELVDDATGFIYYRLTLEGVLITSQNCNAVTGTNKAEETVSMNFAKIKVESFDSKGTLVHSAGYDISQNRVL